MAPAVSKRARPSFSPPRPKTKTSKAANGVSKSKDTSKKSRGRQSLNNASRKTPHSRDQSLSIAENESEEPPNEESEASSQEHSPEPDFILAEVTQEISQSSSEPAIPTNLLHRIVNHHFEDKDKTRISTGAKEVLAKYVEVFIREAIARASYERAGGAGNGDEDDSGLGGGAADAWLEVEDLEKIGAQLCLDF